ncbi:MAG: polysaccharide biosynthesis C-terminal domain-containing protein [Methylocystaceae bacterium]|nr:polysaccharide biosynthesis C-terminal domain-containing protein [Methylocystaceae bacterium]
MGKSLLFRVFTIFTGRMAARAAQFVVFLLLARTLEPTEFGWYGLLTTSILLASLLGSLGLRQAVAYRLGQKRLGHAAAIHALLLILPVLALLPSAAVWLADGGNLRAAGLGEGGIILAVLLATAGALTVMIMQGVLLGLGRTTGFSLSDSLYPIVLMLTVGVLWLTGTVTFLRVLAAVVGSYCLAGLLTTMLAARGWQAIGERIAAPEVFDLVRHGIAFAVNLFLITLSARVSIYIVEHLMSDAAAGQFFAGQRFNDIVTQIAMSVGMVLFSDTVRSDDPRAVLHRNVKIAANILWVLGLVGVALSFFADQLVLLLLGEAYAGTGVVFAIAALMIGPASAAKILYPSLAGMGKPLSGTMVIVTCLVVNAVLSWLLIPLMGIDGAAYALLISQVVLFLGYVIVMYRLFGVPLRDCLLPTLK